MYSLVMCRNAINALQNPVHTMQKHNDKFMITARIIICSFCIPIVSNLVFDLINLYTSQVDLYKFYLF